MLPEQLVNLVHDVIQKKSELQHVELKRALKGTPEKLYDTLSSFSNQLGGGTIIFGISEKDDYEITGVYDAQDVQVQVTNQALQMQPVVRPVFTLAKIDGRTIVGAEISECEIYEKPCYYKGAGRMRGSYIRVGEADQPMTEYEIYSYEVFKRKIQDELRIVERADMQSFDEDALTEYFIKLKKAKPNLAKQTNEKILSLQGFTEKGKPTVAGIMVLGEYPQAYLPQLSITAMLVAGTKFGELGANGERFIDNKRIEGTIPQMLNDALAFVRRNSRNATIINDDGARADRTEYPMKAVREIILNALIHRDYSIHTDNSPIRVILYDDRLEVENPGGLYGRITIDELGKVSADTRNPFIAGALEVLIDTENRFSGIPTIRDEMKSAGLPHAVFESNRGIFKVTLYNQTISKKANVTTQSELDIPLKVIAFCNVPRSRDQIATHLGIDSAYYVVTKYLKPLIESGKLGMTLPKTPKSKNQKYFTVN
jgi:ATP-dependent DNA helicase RecG